MTSLGLESLDLDFQESKVYVILLALGPLSLGEIIKNTEFTSVDTIKSLEGLTTKGYVYQIPGIASRYHSILPFKDLKASNEKTISQMEALSTQLDEHIAQKLGVILGKLREESQKISDGLAAAQSTLNQAEMKAEGDIDARIARYTLEVEQRTDQTKTDIIKTIETKQSDHQSLISNLKGLSEQKANELGTTFQETNQKLLEKYQGGISELETVESQRNQDLVTQIESLFSESKNSLTSGIQNVHQAMDKTGQTLFQSIDERNEKLASKMTHVSTEVARIVEGVKDENKSKVIASLDSFNESLHQQLETSKNEAVGAFASTRDKINLKTENSAQNLKQAISDTLITAQNQLVDMLKQTQESITQKVTEARNQVETSLGEFSEAVKVQTDSDVQKVVINTESTFGGLAQEVKNTHAKTTEEMNTILDEMIRNSKGTSDEISGATVNELTQLVQELKTEIKSHLDQFKETMAPQENFMKEELAKFQSELTTSRNQAKETFKNMMEEFKSSVNVNHKEMEALITQGNTSLLEGVNQFIEGLTGQLSDYDSKFSEIMSASAEKTSEHLIAQTMKLKEKMSAVVNEINKTSTDQLSATNQLVSSSIQAEITTLETELTDYSAKFKDVLQRSEEAFKNYLFSLEKISSLVKDTPHPEVQTAPIVSREAVLTYFKGMFSRMKGGMTLLIPQTDEIPIDLIQETKSHQRINIVSVIDPSKNIDLLKKLFLKPNVRVRSVDISRFEDVDKYVAADRDGEEVIIGVTEDQGETVAIASFSDSFVTLMGKIVLGDYFLARSQEITRAEVGM
ncbi:MAG: hypothetical protein JSV04_13635 [Candidatus Heimdallarchaeota archaeon]|nr:MAG: hypothetical protein JSV04_13635 [Candidatus Heimdallarchaeota archaeon]